MMSTQPTAPADYPVAEVAAQLAARVARQARPLSPQVHLVPGAGNPQLLVVNGSRLFSLPAATATRFEDLLRTQDEAGLGRELTALGLDAPAFITDAPLQHPPVYALSLAIAQKCNMGCTYCYAGGGDFGGPTKSMPLPTALRAIDLLLQECPEGGKVQLTFLGGEPLLNRPAIREATRYAAQEATRRNVLVGFSLTTNGTLLREEDAAFFEAYGFAVTISLDGPRAAHDRQRPMKNGDGSYDRIMKNVVPLLTMQQRMQVSARVTVTPANLHLPETLDELVAMGFHSVGFSPLLRSGGDAGEMTPQDLEGMLRGMIACGLTFERNVLRGKRYPFLNMVNALKEIARGTHRPYPCGAGAGYLGVSADGELAACHRFVNEPAGKMGNLEGGIDRTLQHDWLSARHVHTQRPCNACWARYLCGGGCHHEVLAGGRHACDYIRGWLHYTLQAHGRLAHLAPDWYR